MDLEALNRRMIACRKCPRLVEWREAVARTKRKAFAESDYWGKPVPGFGDQHAKILVVGLAPGAHGSNRTGRQFTGDASGRFLYPSLHRAGFSTMSESTAREDGLALRGLYLTAVCRCVPPANKPAPDELARCRPYLAREIELLAPRVIVCLGRLAFRGVLNIHGLRESNFAFAHGATHLIAGAGTAFQRWLVCSYHPSQQNTLTGKLTAPMFDGIWITAKELARHDHL
jgi:uracil-DNA glycosylase family 4